MQIDQARALQQALALAIKQAEEKGSDQVQLVSNLQQLDDEARAELQAAIEVARR